MYNSLPTYRPILLSLVLSLQLTWTNGRADPVQVPVRKLVLVRLSPAYIIIGRMFPLIVTVESPLSIKASGAGRAASVIRNSILRPVIGGCIKMPPWGVTRVTIVVLPLALSAILLFVIGATPRPWKTLWGPYLMTLLGAPIQQKLLTFPMTQLPTYTSC